MNKMQPKTKIIIGISFLLSLITVVAIYGFGWWISAEQNLLLALAGLPEQQKWQIQGKLVLNGKQLENPITFDFNGRVDLSAISEKIDSRWQLEGEPFGTVNLLNLAKDKENWLIEVPTVSKAEIWQIPAGESRITKDDILRWIQELQFQKAGYRLLEREYGGSISCLWVQSEANTLPAKLIDWLEKIADQDLTAERKQELQAMIKDSLKIAVEAYLTPDMKIMELAVVMGLEGNFSLEIGFTARPEQGTEPNLDYYQTKEKVEVSADKMEDLLRIVENIRQEVVE